MKRELSIIGTEVKHKGTGEIAIIKGVQDDGVTYASEYDKFMPRGGKTNYILEFEDGKIALANCYEFEVL